MNSAVRFVALLEALKGLLSLLAATGLLSLVHKDLHALALRLVEHAHLNPAARYPEIFLAAASNLQNSRLVFLALGAAAYSVLRFVEAYGLFRGRTWAEVLAAASGAIYLPFELVEFVHRPSALHAALLAGNLAVVLLMVGALVRRRLRAPGSVA
ncbi:DUF2127 domain-containing protein [Piscinibacter sp.]|uniref:DUF2127 domain-containing protein n=1 Tax=Piscinibacter sp. TaxID=1903157 RepID=UPI0039E30BF5